MRLDHATWSARYRRMSDIADRIHAMRLERARKACSDAGLDPGLLGIHPHNAMVSAEYGQPWPEIDYSKVRLCIRIMERLPSPSALISTWDRRVRLAKEGS